MANRKGYVETQNGLLILAEKACASNEQTRPNIK